MCVCPLLSPLSSLLLSFSRVCTALSPLSRSCSRCPPSVRRPSVHPSVPSLPLSTPLLSKILLLLLSPPCCRWFVPFLFPSPRSPAHSIAPSAAATHTAVTHSADEHTRAPTCMCRVAAGVGGGVRGCARGSNGMRQRTRRGEEEERASEQGSEDATPLPTPRRLPHCNSRHLATCCLCCRLPRSANVCVGGGGWGWDGGEGGRPGSPGPPPCPPPPAPAPPPPRCRSRPRPRSPPPLPPPHPLLLLLPPLCWPLCCSPFLPSLHHARGHTCSNSESLSFTQHAPCCGSHTGGARWVGRRRV